MKKFSLEDNGIETFKIDKKIKKLISFEIKKNISLKLNIKLNSSFLQISKKINSLKDQDFSKLFGVVSYRYLPLNVTKQINLYLKRYKFNRNFKKISLHQLSKTDVFTNPSLKINQYCVYYRIVRKNKNDVSYPHRDSDFWKIHKHKKNLIPKTPFKYKKRLKVWFPIYGCDKKNSLRFFDGSHLENIKSNFKDVKGFKKPLIDENYLFKNKKRIVMPIKNFLSDAVLFHDDCVHFAPKNSSKNLRVSCEFTAIIS